MNHPHPHPHPHLHSQQVQHPMKYLNKKRLYLPGKLSVEDFRQNEIEICVKQYVKYQECCGLCHEHITQRRYLQSLIPETKEFYDKTFIRNFLLIKINSLLQKECSINGEFLQKIISFINNQSYEKVKVSTSDREIFAQIILQNNIFQYVHFQELDNILDGGCLVASTCLKAISETECFLEKAEISFSLSLTALQGKARPFISIVHQQKNHNGQMQFAKNIRPLIILHHSIPNLNQFVVQDSYSIRCSPQVYGVVYDCLSELKSHLPTILNKFHFKYITINAQKYPNLMVRSETQTLRLDFLLASLNEIGSMALLRSERILNSYLGKNTVQKQKKNEHLILLQLLQQCIHCLAENKELSAPSNCDTMNLCNYKNDIYFNDGKNYKKLASIINNLYKILALEISTALEAITNVYHNKNVIQKQNNTEQKQGLSHIEQKQGLSHVEQKQGLSHVHVEQKQTSSQIFQLFENERMNSQYLKLLNHVTSNHHDMRKYLQEQWKILHL